MCGYEICRDNINMAGNIFRKFKPHRMSRMLYADFRTEVTVKRI